MSFSVDLIRHLYHFTPHYFEIDGRRCHYLDEGEGDPIIMLHGNPSWSFMYRELIGPLQRSHRVIVPDHIGCGLSDKPSDEQYSYRLEQRVTDLEALLEEIGADRDITLVMHDWGGPIGMGYASRHPARVARFVIFNTTAFLLPAGKQLHWTLRFCRNSSIAAFLIRRFNLFAWCAGRVGFRARALPGEVRRAYRGPYDSWENRIAILRFVQDIPLTGEDASYEVLRRTQESLPEFRETPMLICWGENDFVFDADFLDEWTRRFPQAEVHRFSEAGHYVLEDMCQSIIPLVRSFVASNPVRHQPK
ncbi:MAG: alpha/beta fold hydrolase [Acidobacteriota bacterium]